MVQQGRIELPASGLPALFQDPSPCRDNRITLSYNCESPVMELNHRKPASKASHQIRWTGHWRLVTHRGFEPLLMP